MEFMIGKPDEPATKGDLKEAVVLMRSELKSEISGLRTELKAEISGVRTELKAEITETRKVLGLEILKTNDRIDRFEARFMGEFADFKSTMASMLDKVAGHLQDFRRETAIWPQVMDRQGAMLRDHERRLGRLENT